MALRTHHFSLCILLYPHQIIQLPLVRVIKTHYFAYLPASSEFEYEIDVRVQCSLQEEREIRGGAGGGGGAERDHNTY
jgi:hypothetical protein